MGREKNDKPLPSVAARPNTFMRGGSSKDLLDNQSQEEQRREMLETVKQLTGGVDMERGSTEADRSKMREAGESFACFLFFFFFFFLLLLLFLDWSLNSQPCAYYC
jgi:translation initiation factor 4G